MLVLSQLKRYAVNHYVCRDSKSQALCANWRESMSELKSTEKFTISNLVYLLGQNNIDLNPEYQRDAVWTSSQKKLLIDSLLRDIDIPKLYFRRVSNGSYKFEVVDGQQRLRAIVEFMDGGYQLDDSADPVDKMPIAGCRFTQLPLDLTMKLQNYQLDVVVFSNMATDEYIEDMFTRLQNGTPLNAAEKRRALPGNMRDLVSGLADHKVFTELVGFSNKRYAHEDAVAKGLHQIIEDRITDIKPSSIAKTYKANAAATEKTPFVERYRKSLNFMINAFRNSPSPQFKKYEMVTLPLLLLEMLDTYDLQRHAGKFADCYLKLAVDRAKNAEKDESKQDSRLLAYDSATRSDRLQDMQYRHDFVRQRILSCIPDLALKDPKRGFSDEQRNALYFISNGLCAHCGNHCDQSDFHADHIRAHSAGGQTQVSNGQLLCPACNRKKGDK
jgi:5-methylcytosine-specific restriction endonuclease McrA